MPTIKGPIKIEAGKELPKEIMEHFKNNPTRTPFSDSDPDEIQTENNLEIAKKSTEIKDES